MITHIQNMENRMKLLLLQSANLRSNYSNEIMPYVTFKRFTFISPRHQCRNSSPSLLPYTSPKHKPTVNQHCFLTNRFKTLLMGLFFNIM